jgi:hypothetical protein
MATIRPFEAEDVPVVAGLMRANMRDWRRDEEFLVRTLVDDPWVDEELPSLVAVDEDEQVIGFVGSQVRRMVLDDRPIRGVCVAHLVVAPGKRAGAAGALLLSKLLAGPQELSFSDSANEAVVRMWRAFGGYVDHARVCDWMLVLRPARWFAGVAGAVARRRSVGRQEVPVGALPLHAVPGLGRGAKPQDGGDVSSETATSAAIVETLPATTRGYKLRVAYDEAHLEHMVSMVEAGLAPLTRRIVRRGDRPIGWYAYLTMPGGVRRVLHLSAPEREADAVLNRLMEDAKADGGSVLTGRLSPGLEGVLHSRLAVLGFARKPVVHSHDPELRALAGTGASLITQLDSEWYVV